MDLLCYIAPIHREYLKFPKQEMLLLKEKIINN